MMDKAKDCYCSKLMGDLSKTMCAIMEWDGAILSSASLHQLKNGHSAGMTVY